MTLTNQLFFWERRDPEFDTEMAKILHTYQQVKWALEDDAFQSMYDVMLPYDEKPGFKPSKTNPPTYYRCRANMLTSDAILNTSGTLP